MSDEEFLKLLAEKVPVMRGDREKYHQEVDRAYWLPGAVWGTYTKRGHLMAVIEGPGWHNLLTGCLRTDPAPMDVRAPNQKVVVMRYIENPVDHTIRGVYDHHHMLTRFVPLQKGAK